MALRCEHCGERCDNAVGLCDEHMKAEFTQADIDAAVAAEREACATMVEEHGPTWGDEARDALIDAANAIRARGAKKGDGK